MKNNLLPLGFALLALTPASSQASVVFSNVSIANNTITITNSSDSENVDLSGWRFCSHDLDSARRYTSTSFLNGISLAAGESLTFEASAINAAGPFQNNAFSIGLYSDDDGALSFGSANDLAAFVQFTSGEFDNLGSSQARTATAIAAGLWDATGSFVDAGNGATEINLNNLAVSDGASSFTAIPEPSSTLLGALGLAFGIARRRRA